MESLTWLHSSPYNNPPAEHYYTLPIVFEDEEFKYSVQLFMDGNELIFKETAHRYSEKMHTLYWSLGEFPEWHNGDEVMEVVKEFAEYVMTGYSKRLSLSHCPGKVFLDDRDENFNPI